MFPSWFCLLLICFFVCTMAIFVPALFVPSGPSDGQSVPWRPAPLNYILVWSILSILLSVSMCFALLRSNEDGRWVPDATHGTTYVLGALYIGILTTCAAWSPVYHGRRKADGVTVFLWLWLLLGPLLTLLATGTREFRSLSLVTLSPLAVWSLFQMGVNAREVELDQSRCTGHRTHS